MGVLYGMNLDGTGFEKLRDFSLAEGRPGKDYVYSGSGLGSLVGSGDRIFGTLHDGTSNWEDRVWARQLGFSGAWSELVPASWRDGPITSFIDGNWIYGFSVWGGGNNGRGTVFRVSLDGEVVETLKVFYGGSDGDALQQIVLGDQAIYGVTSQGGSANKGMIFKMNKDGSDYKSLHFFIGERTSPQSIVYLQGKIYGISLDGGVATPADNYPDGFLFSLNTDGTGYKILKTFFGDNDSTASMGDPKILATDGSLLYIAMGWGGPDGKDGGLISIKPDGTGQKTLVEFSDAPTGSTGNNPVSLIYSGGRLYGANANGGAGQTGTVWSYALDANGDPAPYSGPLYSAVTFGGSMSSVQELGFSQRTLRGITTTINAQKMAAIPLNNALVLERARQDGLLASSSGYSIVCTDTEQGLEFYAYKKDSPLVSLETQLGFIETATLQAATTTDVSNAATGSTKSSVVGTDKVCGEGVFLGKQVSMSRTVNYKSADAVINGQPSRYYPGTSKGVFFGLDEAGTEFVEGTFSIAAPTTIQVP